MDLVGEALARLDAAGVLTAVRGVHSVERDGAETILVSVGTEASPVTRESIAQALDGLPYECVERPPSARGVAHGLTGIKDGRSWPIGSQTEVAWINDTTSSGRTITAAIPPVFSAYATVVIPEGETARQASESALLRRLTDRSPAQPWWLGYLETGAHDVVFDRAARVTLYDGWNYVLVQAGPVQAGTWRADDPWRGRLPDLIYPADRSWLVSMLWDDDWRCVGGDASLIEALVAEPALRSYVVDADADATPPGHVAR